MHIETSFTVTVHAPASNTAKLFTPEGERAWAGKQWDPRYLYPAGSSRDAVGAVFTIQPGPVQAVWTVIRRDDTAREYDYAYFIPNIMITTISVQFEPVSAVTTAVHVHIGRTALSPEGAPHLQAMNEIDRNAGPEWQTAIEKYLATQTPATP